MTTYRLASYNIRKCLGTDRKRAPGRILDVINTLDADVVALQEVDLRLGPRPAALPRDMINTYSDFKAIDVATSAVSLGWHGNSILVRNGLTVTSVLRIDLPGLEPRGAICVEIGTNDGPLRVVGTHLGLLRRYRLLQLQTIADRIETFALAPTAILGDFNEWSNKGGMTPLSKDYHVHAPGHSFHAQRPVAKLDRIAVNEYAHLHMAGVLKTGQAPRASDHLPVWGDVHLRTPS
ncbi:MAG: endonuclease/exonuclease/phosphatase family protein [Pseudoruegeria sp.]